MKNAVHTLQPQPAQNAPRNRSSDLLASQGHATVGACLRSPVDYGRTRMRLMPVWKLRFFHASYSSCEEEDANFALVSRRLKRICSCLASLMDLN